MKRLLSALLASAIVLLGGWSISVAAPSYLNASQLSTTTTSGYYLESNGPNSPGTFAPVSALGIGGTTGQYPYFSSTNTLSATSTPFLAANGNLGIGTTSPAYLLDVNGNLSAASIVPRVPSNSVVIVIGESLAMGYGVVSVGPHDAAGGYLGPGYCWAQWLSVLLPGTPVYDYGITAASSTQVADILAYGAYGSTEYLNGTVVGGYSGTAGAPSTHLASVASGGINYFINTYDGHNDVAYGVSLVQYEANMTAAFATEHGYQTNDKVMSVTSQVSASNSVLLTSPYNNWTRSELGISGGIDYLLDAATTFTNNNNLLWYQSDNTHFVSAGYLVYAKMIANAFLNGNANGGANFTYPGSTTLVDGSAAAYLNSGLTMNSGNIDFIDQSGYLFNYHKGTSYEGIFPGSSYQLRIFTAGETNFGTVNSGQSVAIGSMSSALAFTPYDTSNATGFGIGTSTPYAPLSVASDTNALPIAVFSGKNPLVQIGSSSPTYGWLVNDRLNIIDNRNDYSADNSYNLSTGACATADKTEANDLNSTALNFFDMGHTSSGFTGIGCTNNPFTGFGANASYLFDPSGDINIDAVAGNLKLFTGGYATANIKAELLQNGNFGIGSTTPTANLQVTAVSSNATTSIEFGKLGQTSGDCVTHFDTAGTAVYEFFGAGSITPTYTHTKPAGCQS